MPECQGEVHALRVALQDHDIVLPSGYDTDFTLDRWLTAYDGRLSVIIPKINDTLQFRAAMQLDLVPGIDDCGMDDWVSWQKERFSHTLVDFYPGGFLGYANNGDVVVLEPIGRIDPRGLAHSVSCSQFLKLRLFVCERIRKLVIGQEKKLAKRCGLVYIIDAEGMCMDQLWMPSMHVYMHLVTLMQEYFPDALNAIIVINAPAVLQVAFKMISPVLSKKTKEKLQILQDIQWKNVIAKHIDTQFVPEQWGGILKTNDASPYGRIKMAGKVPMSLYLPSPQMHNHMSQFTVGRGSLMKQQIELEDDKENREIHWKLYVPSGDIYFRVYHTSTNQNETILYPRMRINTEFVVDEGFVPAFNKGVVIMEFDNSHSYMKSKTLNLYHHIMYKS